MTHRNRRTRTRRGKWSVLWIRCTSTATRRRVWPRENALALPRLTPYDHVPAGVQAGLASSYDRTGNTLSVWFDDPKKEHLCEEIGDDVILMKDGAGRVIG